MDAIVRKLLEPDPAKRYAEAAHVREDLERQLAHRPLAYARDSSVRERARKWRQPTRGWPSDWAWPSGPWAS